MRRVRPFPSKDPGLWLTVVLITIDRRAQFLVAESTLASSPDVTDSLEDGASTCDENESDEEYNVGDEVHQRHPSHGEDGMLGLEWDGFNSSPGSAPLGTPFLPSSQNTPFVGPVDGSPPMGVHEQTPLLRRVSFSANAHPRRPLQRPLLTRPDQLVTYTQEEPRRPVLRPIIRRAPSSGSVAHSTMSKKIGGHSTFGQTVSVIRQSA